MHTYTLYDPDTGELKGAGGCSRMADVELNTPPSLRRLDGVYQPDRRQYKVVDGEVVKRPPQEIKPLPNYSHRKKKKVVLEEDWEALVARVNQLEHGNG